MKPGVLLLISNSYDATADLLVSRLGKDKVFRFNFDLWHDYHFEISPKGFFLSDPSGREIVNDRVIKALWRKPVSRVAYRPASRTYEDRYYDGEMLYAMRDLVNLLWLDGRIVLVEPFAELHAGKFVQLRLAAAHLQVPDFQFRLGVNSIFRENQETVVKSLTMEPVGNAADRELVFTTKVEDHSLSPDCPWMVQQYIRAHKDITIAFVYDQLFAFELDRGVFVEQITDWRELPPDWEQGDWRPHKLPEDVASRVFGFMQDMGLHFGRLDFLWGDDGYFFLEVNSNGEWGWLDPEGRYGLLSKVVAEVSPDTPVHALPFLRFAIR
ncbi:MAG: hypothetical protein P8168_04420 [Deltaproteobacteria bacterium]